MLLLCSFLLLFPSPPHVSILLYSGSFALVDVLDLVFMDSTYWDTYFYITLFPVPLL